MRAFVRVGPHDVKAEIYITHEILATMFAVKPHSGMLLGDMSFEQYLPIEGHITYIAFMGFLSRMKQLMSRQHIALRKTFLTFSAFIGL